MTMFEKIKSSLSKLEIRLKPSFNAFNTDNDGFLTALVGADQKEKYKTAHGYDIMAALDDAAIEDWSDYNS